MNFDCLWFSEAVSVHCKEKFPWRAARTTVLLAIKTHIQNAGSD